MKNILYIGTPSSIHDQKWIRYFAQQKNNYNTFILFEEKNIIDADTRNKLKSQNIHLLPPIQTFSISSPLKTLKSVVKIKRIVKELNIDLIHILFASPHALWLNFLRIPSIITTRGSDVLIVIPNLLSSTGFKKIYFNWLFNQFKKAFKRCNYVTSTSSGQIKKIEELFHSKNIALIRTGIDVESIISSTDKSQLPPILANNKFIFSPRFFTPIYNIDIQVEAISKLPRNIIEKYIFVFVRGNSCDSSYSAKIENKLKALANSINLKYKIEDYLDQKTLWTYYNFASLTIMTPTSDGTPNSALEAMAAKCPLIMPDLNYDKDLFENTCLILKGNNATSLSDLIVKSIDDYPKCLINKAFSAVNKFGNRTTEMNKLNDIYVKILTP